MGYIIREKELKDCEDWVSVNISSWNDNLKGIISDIVLEKISSNKEERIKKEIENFKQDDCHYVLEENNEIVGILKIKESDRDCFIGYGEVQVLYLLSSVKGKGYGKALICELSRVKAYTIIKVIGVTNIKLFVAFLYIFTRIIERRYNMTREEKEQLWREKFLKAQEIHRQRELEREFYEKRYEESKKSIAETDKNKLSISLVVLDLLEELGFERTASGTEYLADVIETLYHERKIFDGENKFFDFDDKNNNHYSFTNEYYECGLINLKRQIAEEVAKSYVSDSSLNDIIYGVANDVISQYDRCGKQLVLSSKK